MGQIFQKRHSWLKRTFRLCSILCLHVFVWYCLFVILAHWMPLGIHNLAARCISPLQTSLHHCCLDTQHTFPILTLQHFVIALVDFLNYPSVKKAYYYYVQKIYFSFLHKKKTIFNLFILETVWTVCLLLWCSLHLMAWCALNDPLMIIMTIIYLMTCKFISKGQARRNHSMFSMLYNVWNIFLSGSILMYILSVNIVW